MMQPGTWTKGKRKITGWWEYYRPSDTFTIVLDSKDPVTGQERRVVTHNDKPEFNGWKLEEVTK